MKPIIPKKKRRRVCKNGNVRHFVTLPNGTETPRARWMMMNFLHTEHIPKRIHIHHENEITDDDRIENFQLKINSEHNKFHNPRDYKFGVSWSDDPMAYQKARRNATPENKKTHTLDSRRYVLKHKEKVAESNRSWRIKNAQSIKIKKHEYYLRKKEKSNALSQLQES
jgi:hypothetical protein